MAITGLKRPVSPDVVREVEPKAKRVAVTTEIATPLSWRCATIVEALETTPDAVAMPTHVKDACAADVPTAAMEHDKKCWAAPSTAEDAQGMAAAAAAEDALAKDVPEQLRKLKGYIINLERRPDRLARCQDMLQKETPWLAFEQFMASDGTCKPIPESEIAMTWNTCCNAHFADYFEWVFDAPGTSLDKSPWKWACDTGKEDPDWTFTEEGDEEWPEWTYVHDAGNTSERLGRAIKTATGEAFRVRLQFAQRYIDPGLEQRMSGGERGCAHSHLCMWRLAAERTEPTLVLEDDIQFCFTRSDSSLGEADGHVFTRRLALAMQHAPSDFDVLYLGWSGWRDGHNRHPKDSEEQRPDADNYLRRAEYVWTTVAYVLTQAGAKRLLAAAKPTINQPVDNFMAWESSQGRLNAYVLLDEGDTDYTWAGGIVDQFDFQGDSDITKSDGGHQGDDEKAFAVTSE